MPSQPHAEAENGSPSTALLPSAPPAEEVDSLDHSRWETEVSVQYRDSGYDSSRSLGRASQMHKPQRSLTHDGIAESAQTAELPTHMAREASARSHHSQSANEQPQPVAALDRSQTFSHFDFTEGGSAGVQPPTDDKEELERRRLQAQRSAPDYGESGPSHTEAFVPMVPSEDDHYTTFGEWDPSQEGLPKYEG